MTLSPFIYDQPVTGKNFVGRRQDLAALTNLFTAGENVVLVAAPKSGKTSLVRQVFLDMKVTGTSFVPASVSLLGVRSLGDFISVWGDGILRAVAYTPDEYADEIAANLEGSCFRFDQDNFSASDRILGVEGVCGTDDLRALIALPRKIALRRGLRIYVVLDEFQNIEFIPEADSIFRALEAEMSLIASEGLRTSISFVISGSKINAMRELLGTRHTFSPLVEQYFLPPVTAKEISDHIVKGLLSSGKVIEEEMLAGICNRFRNNIWYIEHFAGIMDHLSRGYVTEPVLMEALSMIIAIHEDRFRSMMYDLTNYQVSLLKAVLDGHTKLSSAEVIEGYGLNSSANVKRLREALMKKEIITFDEKDHPIIIDPLFEYWVRKYFFKMELAD
ncbi:MAG: ATP-binding protein [Bacteroidales bacterium]|nr:ATP-binding protein [Bacteroidales bacterium]